MAEKPPTFDASALLHELAEALQAVGNYLGALSHGANPGLSHLSEQQIVERALAQWVRAQQATHELRAYLNGRDRSQD